MFSERHYSCAAANRLSGSPRFAVRYFWYTVWRMFTGSIGMMFRNPLVVLPSAMCICLAVKYYSAKKVKNIAHFHLSTVLFVVTLPSQIGGILKLFDGFFAFMKFLVINFFDALGIPVPTTLLTATCSSAALVDTYFLWFSRLLHLSEVRPYQTRFAYSFGNECGTAGGSCV